MLASWYCSVKSPKVLSYIAELQRVLEQDTVVGKTSSLADIVAQVGTVLHDGDPAYRVVPASAEELGQYLLLFQMSGDPGDLDNFVDYDYRLANVWVQMKRGDNRDMTRVEESLAVFMDQNECNTVIAAARAGAGLPPDEILTNLEQAVAKFTRATREKFARPGK